jgi:hypothetical protein
MKVNLHLFFCFFLYDSAFNDLNFPDGNKRIYWESIIQGLGRMGLYTNDVYKSKFRDGADASLTPLFDYELAFNKSF